LTSYVQIYREIFEHFQCPTAKETVAHIASFFGVPEKDVFPIVNYFEEKQKDDVKEILAINMHSIGYLKWLKVTFGTIKVNNSFFYRVLY
jgi:hypothetical protein